MKSKEKKIIHKSHTDEIYRAIGKFVVEFELICYWIRFGITFILHNEGLHNQNVTQILLARIGAEELRSSFESLVNELYNLNDIEKKIFKNAIKRFQDLITDRNNVVHSTWFVGYGNENSTDFKTTVGHKPDKNKSGVKWKSFSYTAENFHNLTKEANSLANIFQRLQGLLTAGISFDNEFKIDENGEVRVP